MERRFPPELIEEAHKATIYHEQQILNSSVCTCFYCGYQFDPRTEEELAWIDEGPNKERTLSCPMCTIDCVIGDASAFPVTDSEFILACTEAWFGGISRISDGLPVQKATPILIEVD